MTKREILLELASVVDAINSGNDKCGPGVVAYRLYDMMEEIVKRCLEEAADPEWGNNGE